MSTAKISLPPVEVSSRAAAVLAANSAGNSSRIHALNKAAFMLAREAVEIVHGWDGWLITSATRASVVHRVSSISGCSCEAGQRGQVCWHAALVEVLEESGRYALPLSETAPMGKPVAERIAAERSARYAEALQSVNELFG